MENESTVMRSRRAVIGAALGGAAALAAANVARPLAVRAADGDNALIGNLNQGESTTEFQNTSSDGTSLQATHDGNGTAFSAATVTGTGAMAWASATDSATFTDQTVGVFAGVGDPATHNVPVTGVGVFGFADWSAAAVGVLGESGSGTGVVGVGDWGVYGTGSVGVIGDVGSSGVGVYGFTGNVNIPAPPTGVGVYARAASTSQTALQVVGKVKFSRSGRVAISEGASSKLVTLGGVTDRSYVIATLQTSSSGLYVRAVVPASGQFRIYLSKAAPKRVVVGYLVVN